MKEILSKAVIDAAEIVASTFGPDGKNVFIANTSGGKRQMFTRDGMAVAQALAESWEGLEGAGARLLLDACMRTAKVVGDGTTTTAMLVASLLKSGVDAAYLQRTTPEILKRLNGSVSDCDLGMLINAVSISANNNNSLGRMIAQLVWQVGHTASVQGVSDLGGETRTEIRQGYLTGGVAHPVFWNSPHALRAKTSMLIQRPMVALFDQPLEKDEQAVQVLRAYDRKAPLIIVAPSFGDAALRTIIKNHTENNMPVFPVILNEDRVHSFKDLSVGTGGGIFAPYGMKVSQFSMSHCGVCDSVEIRGDGARFMFSEEFRSSIDAHLNLEERNRERTGQLHQGIGLVYIGGQTEAEQGNLNLIVEDAVMCAQSCLRDGVLPGKGAALAGLAKDYPEIADALCAPAQAIFGGLDDPLDAAMSVIKAYEHAASLVIEILKTQHVCA